MSILKKLSLDVAGCFWSLPCLGEPRDDVGCVLQSAAETVALPVVDSMNDGTMGFNSLQLYLAGGFTAVSRRV